MGSSIAVHERKRRHRTDAGDERSARTVVTHSSIGRTEHRNRARSGCLIVGAAAGRITWFSRSWFASVLIRRSGSPCSDGVRQRAGAMRFICRRTAHRCAPSSLRSLTWARRVHRPRSRPHRRRKRPSLHMACMITASLRATATQALRWQERLAMSRPQLLTLSLPLKRVISPDAAS